MKLIECHVSGFGRLVDKKYRFTDGLNVFEEINGSGKTTLTYFIKAMLYGIGDTKKASLEENDRKHYAPWSGGAFGGSLTFEVEKGVYRVERTFGKRPSEDKFKLYNLRIGRESLDYTEKLGEELFGIDSDGFERTVFLSERALSPKSDNVTLTAKLSDLADADADLGTLDKAMKILADQRRFYSKRGGSGEINEVESRITECEQRLAEIDNSESALARTEARLAELDRLTKDVRGREEELGKQREALTVRSMQAGYLKQLDEMRSRLAETEKKRDTLHAFFSRGVPKFDELNEANYKKQEAEKLLSGKSEMSAKSSELESLKALFAYRVTKDEVEETRGAIYALERGKKREKSEAEERAERFFDKRRPAPAEFAETKNKAYNRVMKRGVGLTSVLAIFGILAFGGGFTLGNTFGAEYFAISLVGIVLFASIFISRALAIKRRRLTSLATIRAFLESVTSTRIEDDSLERTLDEAAMLYQHLVDDSSEEQEYEERIKAFSAKFFTRVGGNPISDARELIDRYDRYTTLLASEAYISANLSDSIARGKALEREAREFFSAFDVGDRDPYTVVSEKLNEYHKLTSDIVSMRQQISALESVNCIGTGSQSSASIDDINRRAELLKLDADKISAERAILEGRKRELLDDVDTRTAVITERDALCEKRKRYQHQFRVIKLTEKYLTDAKDMITSKYLGKTQRAFEKYVSTVDGSCGEFEMDSDFGISRLESGVTHPTEAYSRGQRDLYRLAARLSLVDSLYENEAPFIILDDPFISFDDARVRDALRLLESLATERQILYFTCSSSRTPRT